MGLDTGISVLSWIQTMIVQLGTGGSTRRRWIVLGGYACLILSLVFNIILWTSHLPNLRDRLANTGCDIPAESALAKDMFKSHFWDARWNLLWLVILQGIILFAGALASRMKTGSGGIFAASMLANTLMAILLGFLAHTAFYNKPAAAYDAAAAANTATDGTGCLGTFKGYRDTAQYASTFAGVSIIAAGLYVISIVAENTQTEKEHNAVFTVISDAAKTFDKGDGFLANLKRFAKRIRWWSLGGSVLTIASLVFAAILFGLGPKSRDDAISDCTDVAAAATPSITTPDWFQNTKDDTNGYISTTAVFVINIVLSMWTIVSFLGWHREFRLFNETIDKLNAMVEKIKIQKVFHANKLMTTIRVSLEMISIVFWARLLMQWHSYWLPAVFASYGCSDISVSEGGFCAWAGFITAVLGAIIVETSRGTFAISLGNAAAALSLRRSGDHKL